MSGCGYIKRNMPGLFQWGFSQWAEHYAAGSHKRTATDCQSAVKSARWETTSSSPQGKALDRNRWGEGERILKRSERELEELTPGLTQRCWMRQSSGNHGSRLARDDGRGSSIWDMNKTKQLKGWSSNKVNTMQENMLCSREASRCMLRSCRP